MTRSRIFVFRNALRLLILAMNSVSFGTMASAHFSY
jgi:hypothetical protein